MQTCGSLADNNAYIAAHLLQGRVHLNAEPVIVIRGRVPHKVDTYVKNGIARFVALFYELGDNVLKRQIRAVGGVAH